MKCTRCGAEVEAQRFCIYCGERLQPRENIHVQRAPSGVMRFRHRTSISQSALPEVQRKGPDSSKVSQMSLASLNNCHLDESDNYLSEMQKDPLTSSSMEGMAMKENQGQSVRQSRELEALLLKLNGNSSEKSSAKKAESLPPKPVERPAQKVQQVQETIEDDLLDEESSLHSMDSVEVSLDDSLSLDDSISDGFFVHDETNTSGPIPVGSGSFSRVPSGGFHLVIDSIKSACKGVIRRIQAVGKSSSPNTPKTDLSSTEQRNKKLAKIGVGAAIVFALVCMIVAVATTPTEETPEIAAQAPVAGNDDYAIIPLDEPDDITTLTFDGDDDFTIPELEGNAQDDAKVEATKEAAKQAAMAAAVPKDEPATAKTSGNLKELRLYNRNDNVLAAPVTAKSQKINKSCIMREGPASRFPLIKQLSPGTNIQVLVSTEEDWVLEKGGLWTKNGQTKLGPGTQFADASKGMKLPQPTSRVISSNNWRYIQVGNLYGYVGPACFK